MVVIKQITVDEVLPLWHSVLWPEKSVDFCRLPADDSGLHYGLYIKELLISCVSAFIDIAGYVA